MRKILNYGPPVDKKHSILLKEVDEQGKPFGWGGGTIPSVYIMKKALEALGVDPAKPLSVRLVLEVEPVHKGATTGRFSGKAPPADAKLPRGNQTPRPRQADLLDVDESRTRHSFTAPRA